MVGSHDHHAAAREETGVENFEHTVIVLDRRAGKRNCGRPGGKSSNMNQRYSGVVAAYSSTICGQRVIRSFIAFRRALMTRMTRMRKWRLLDKNEKRLSSME